MLDGIIWLGGTSDAVFLRSTPTTIAISPVACPFEYLGPIATERTPGTLNNFSTAVCLTLSRCSSSIIRAQFLLICSAWFLIWLPRLGHRFALQIEPVAVRIASLQRRES